MGYNAQRIIAAGITQRCEGLPTDALRELHATARADLGGHTEAERDVIFATSFAYSERLRADADALDDAALIAAWEGCTEPTTGRYVGDEHDTALRAGALSSVLGRRFPTVEATIDANFDESEPWKAWGTADDGVGFTEWAAGMYRAAAGIAS